MESTRAKDLAGGKNRSPLFSDFKRNFNVSPFGNQLVKITNEDSIKESVRNIILTAAGDRLFQPSIGCNITDLLFENFDSPTDEPLLETFIRNALMISEPRVIFESVDIVDYSDRNQIELNVKFKPINNSEILSINVFLKRVR